MFEMSIPALCGCNLEELSIFPPSTCQSGYASSGLGPGQLLLSLMSTQQLHCGMFEMSIPALCGCNLEELNIFSLSLSSPLAIQISLSSRVVREYVYRTSSGILRVNNLLGRLALASQQPGRIAG
jgi:hypothetical protein